MLFGTRRLRDQSDAAKLELIESMYAQARRAFPDVPEMTAREVLDHRDAGAPIVIVDTRTPAEQAVSMIPGAITAEEFQASPPPTDVPVVCYCTIGGRSGRYATELRRRGIDAYNMPGAILAWSHEGGELVRDGEPTMQLHTHGPSYELAADGYEMVN